MCTQYRDLHVPVTCYLYFDRQIFTLNAAHELPSTLEEALLLWLRKIAEAVTRAHQQEKALMLQVHVYRCRCTCTLYM